MLKPSCSKELVLESKGAMIWIAKPLFCKDFRTWRRKLYIPKQVLLTKASLGVGFWAKNGDSKETSANAERYPLFCCGESAVTHAQVRAFDSPCKAPFLAQKSFREQLAPTSTQSPDSSSTILEENQASPSLRDTALAVAWQSISQTQSEAAHSGSQISPRLLYACENISAFYVAAYFPSDRVYFDANMFYTTPIEVALLAGKIDTCEYESLESKLKAFPRLFIDDEYGRWLLQLYKDLFIHKIAKLWEQKDCIVIEGRYSSSGVYNDLFSNARSVLRINHLPHHNAYELLDELKSYVQEVLSGFDPAHTCAILALGHSAKVLGFWLDGLGFRAFDIGSLSLNYDCFLYGADFYTYAGQGNPLELESYVLAPYIAGKRR